MTNQKQNGAYYTDKILSDFFINRIFEDYLTPSSMSILEPSCGDGVFLKSILSNKIVKKNKKKIEFYAVEKNTTEIKKIEDIFNDVNKKLYKNKIFNTDYLLYHDNEKQKYDLIIGNPPYIKKNHLSKTQIEICEQIHKEAGLDSMHTIKNIWTAFFVSAILKLNDSGIVCMVLPAELLQVQHTKKIRTYLMEHFETIEIFAFNELVFKEIQQDVIVIIASKKAPENKKGVFFYLVEKLSDLTIPDYKPQHNNAYRDASGKDLSKWTNYILSEPDLDYLNSLKNKLNSINSYCVSQVGIVTAANDYFIVDEETIKKYELEKVSIDILHKSSYLDNSLFITKKHLKVLKKAGKTCSFICLPDKSIEELPRNVQEYLEVGVKKGINKRYKMLLRKNWYFINSVWSSQAMFVKRSYMYPKIIINKANVVVTDSFYRVTLHPDYDIKTFIFSFYNRLTFSLAELEGRFYGGGVLELTPNEFKQLAVPYTKISNDEFEVLEEMIKSNKVIDEVLDYTDKILLERGMGLKTTEVRRIKKAYETLRNRRLKRII